MPLELKACPVWNPVPRSGWQCWGVAVNCKTSVSPWKSRSCKVDFLCLRGERQAEAIFSEKRQPDVSWKEGNSKLWNPRKDMMLILLNSSGSPPCLGLCLPPPSPSQTLPIPLSGMTTFFCYEHLRAWLPRDLAIENAVLVFLCLGFLLFASVSCLLSNQITA